MRPSRRRAPLAGRPASGFTIVEVLVVLLVLGILAAVGAPKFAEALANSRAEAAARRIAADLATAQARAKATSSPQTVVFTLPPTGNHYEIVGMSDPDRPATGYTVRLSDPPYQATLVSVALGGGATLVYNGLGVPDRSGTISVQSGSRARTIAIDQSTGMATIQ
jgi:prepilin-type N-terminal cleavage/methylation domain-containing protein